MPKYKITDKLNNSIVETIEANSLLEAYSLFTNSRGFFIDEIVEVKKSILGIDISHWQDNNDNKLDIDFKKLRGKYDFIFIKVSQGTKMKDFMFELFKNEARKYGFVLGFYHFANGEDPIEEAKYFLKSVGEIKKGELLALDYEINLRSDEVKWCEKFLDYTYSVVGFKPLIYLDNSRLMRSDWTPLVKKDYGLWFARYYQNNGELGKIPPIKWWSFFALLQYSSHGIVEGIKGYVDLDIAFMDIETLRKYGKK